MRSRFYEKLICKIPYKIPGIEQEKQTGRTRYNRIGHWESKGHDCKNDNPVKQNFF